MSAQLTLYLFLFIGVIISIALNSAGAMEQFHYCSVKNKVLEKHFKQIISTTQR